LFNVERKRVRKKERRKDRKREKEEKSFFVLVLSREPKDWLRTSFSSYDRRAPKRG